MKPKPSAPCLLATLTNTILLVGVHCLPSCAEEPPVPQIDDTPVVTTPTITWGNIPLPGMSKPALAWQDTGKQLKNNPGPVIQRNNGLQLYQTLTATVPPQTASEQKRLQDAQAAVQASRTSLAQAIEKLNNKRDVSKSQRAMAQEQIDKLAQQLTQNLSRLTAQQDAQAALQARIKQLQSSGLNLRPLIILPNTPTLTLPQDRNLLYTPTNAAALIKRNLLLTPEDHAKTKAIPLHK